MSRDHVIQGVSGIVEAYIVKVWKQPHNFRVVGSEFSVDAGQK